MVTWFGTPFFSSSSVWVHHFCARMCGVWEEQAILIYGVWLTNFDLEFLLGIVALASDWNFNR